MAKKKNKPGWAARPEAKAKASAVAHDGFSVPDVKSTLPPVYVTATGAALESPLACLGFAEDASPTAEEVRRRAAQLLTETPPERDPDRAERILAARRRLTAPEAAFERHVGELRVPDPETWLPGFTRPAASREPDAPAAEAQAAPLWSTQARLAALMGLFTLVEAEIEGTPAPKGRGGKSASKQLDLFGE